MQNAIQIGHEVSKDSAENLKTLIEGVFRVGHETRMEQETIKKALEVIERMVKVENVTVKDSVISGDKHYHMDEGS